MATPGTSTAEHHREHRPVEKSDKPQIVVVDLGRRQTAKQVRRLRRGRGKLMAHVEGIVNDLVTAGTVKATAQPIVIVVREDMPLLFDIDDEDEEDEEGEYDED